MEKRPFSVPAEIRGLSEGLIWFRMLILCDNLSFYGC